MLSTNMGTSGGIGHLEQGNVGSLGTQWHVSR